MAVIAGYWISSFLSDVYVKNTGVYVWNNYPIYDGIRALFGVIAFLAAITVAYVQYVENGSVFFTVSALEEYVARCTHRAAPQKERMMTYRRRRA